MVSAATATAVSASISTPVGPVVRAVAAIAPTSTMRMRPRSSTWDSFLLTALTLHEKEREALERDGQVHALEFDTPRDPERARREVHDRLDARRGDRLDGRLGRRRRNGDDGDADALA